MVLEFDRSVTHKSLSPEDAAQIELQESMISSGPGHYSARLGQSA
jgi:hypothetical protein